MIDNRESIVGSNIERIIRLQSVFKTLIAVVALSIVTSVGCKQADEMNALIVFASASDIGLGEARLPISIVLSDGSRYEDQAASLTVTYSPPDSTSERYAKDLKWRPWPVQGGAYTATMTFDQVGFWTINVKSKDSDKIIATPGAVLVKSSTDSPNVGDPAPLSVTKTTPIDGNLSSITSAPEPDSDLYAISFDQAIKSGKPTVISFSTPAFCSTATCGPQTQVLSRLADKYSGRSNFIHVEIFDNPDEMQQSGDPQVGVESKIVHEWELHTEPWTFIVDNRGIVVGRYEAFVTTAELEETLIPIITGP